MKTPTDLETTTPIDLETNRSTGPRWRQAAAGAALLVVGLMGLAVTTAGTATAQQDNHQRHDAMHRMMDAVHGDGTADRMHAEGGEQMMEDCTSMGSMGSMMRGGRG